MNVISLTLIIIYPTISRVYVLNAVFSAFLLERLRSVVRAMEDVGGEIIAYKDRY